YRSHLFLHRKLSHSCISLFYTISIFYHIIPIMNTHSFKYKNRKQINSDLLSILITYFLHAISLLLLLLYRRIDHMIYIHNEVLLVPHNLSIQLALEYVIFLDVLLFGTAMTSTSFKQN